jgi:GNAT superfamily N-acetyltransferase
MNRPPNIRPLKPGDSLVALTALLHRAYAPLLTMGLNYTAVDQSVEVTTERVRCGTCFVAEAGRELVGTITVRPPQLESSCAWYGQPHVACAGQFAVAPELQRQGLGAKLLARAERWAREGGFSELAVDTAVTATHLVSFYTHRGYRQVEVVQWDGKSYRSAIFSKALGDGLTR